MNIKEETIEALWRIEQESESRFILYKAFFPQVIMQNNVVSDYYCDLWVKKVQTFIAIWNFPPGINRVWI